MEKETNTNSNTDKILNYLDNEDFDIHQDLNNGQIYLIKNKKNGKCYIGQALCFTGSNNNRWGTLGRWNSHIREAKKTNQDHCVLLNNAIRKYEENDFEIFTLLKCHKKDLDINEEKFILEYNSIQPNGYNIKFGGSKSKNSEETILKMKESHLGVRREKYRRKYEEDNELPKYILAHRESGVLVAYVISKFPIGIETKEYLKDIYFRLNNYDTKEEALKDAIKNLDDIKEKYKSINEDIFKEKSIIKPVITLKEKKENKIKDGLPEYIYPKMEDNKIKGYYVDNIYDKEGNLYPKKEFVGKTNRWNLNDAKKYVEQLLYYHANNIDITNFEEIDVSGKNNKVLHEKYHLPKYVNIYNVKGEMKGFMINGYPMARLKCRKYKRAFANENLTIDENYENCIKYLEKIKKQYPINKEKITVV
jgi:hypothetical protein